MLLGARPRSWQAWAVGMKESSMRLDFGSWDLDLVFCVFAVFGEGVDFFFEEE